MEQNNIVAPELHRRLENELLEIKALWDSVVKANDALRTAIENGDIKTAHRLSLTVDIKALLAYRATDKAHDKYKQIFGNDK